MPGIMYLEISGVEMTVAQFLEAKRNQVVTNVTWVLAYLLSNPVVSRTLCRSYSSIPPSSPFKFNYLINQIISHDLPTSMLKVSCCLPTSRASSTFSSNLNWLSFYLVQKNYTFNKLPLTMFGHTNPMPTHLTYLPCITEAPLKSYS